MDREFVLFFFPSSRGAVNSFAPGTGLEIGIAVQTSDRPTAQTALDTLDSLVGDFATSYLSHEWVSEDTLIVTLPALAQMSPVCLNGHYGPFLSPFNQYARLFLNATESLPLKSQPTAIATSTLVPTFSLTLLFLGDPPMACKSLPTRPFVPNRSKAT